MSLRVEWFSVTPGTLEIVPGGTLIGGFAVEEGNVGLAIWGDDAAVVEGTPAAIRAALVAALAQLDALDDGELVPDSYYESADRKHGYT